MAWVAYNSEDQVSRIITQLYDADGQKDGPEHRAFASTDYILDLALTTASNGKVFVTWTSQTSDSDVRSMVLEAAADPVNVAPVVGDVTLPGGQEDSVITITRADLLANAADANDDDLVIAALNVATGGGRSPTMAMRPGITPPLPITTAP